MKDDVNSFLGIVDLTIPTGIQGTDVAKGAADMILTDDNFVSIVGAVERGRVIYAGIQKFVAFIMSVHIGEVMQIFFCVVAGFPIMRKPLQILFLILVTDLPPAVALGMEPGAPGIMKERPRPKTQPIVLRWMWQSIVVNGAILSFMIAVVYMICLDNYCDELSQEKISDVIQLETTPASGLCATVYFELFGFDSANRNWLSSNFNSTFIVEPLMHKLIFVILT